MCAAAVACRIADVQPNDGDIPVLVHKFRCRRTRTHLRESVHSTARARRDRFSTRHVSPRMARSDRHRQLCGRGDWVLLTRALGVSCPRRIARRALVARRFLGGRSRTPRGRTRCGRHRVARCTPRIAAAGPEQSTDQHDRRDSACQEERMAPSSTSRFRSVRRSGTREPPRKARAHAVEMPDHGVDRGAQRIDTDAVARAPAVAPARTVRTQTLSTRRRSSRARNHRPRELPCALWRKDSALKRLRRGDVQQLGLPVLHESARHLRLRDRLGKSLLDRADRPPHDLLSAVFAHAREDLDDSRTCIRPVPQHEDRAPAVREPPDPGAHAFGPLPELIEPAQQADHESAALPCAQRRLPRGAPDQVPQNPIGAPGKQHLVTSPASADVDGCRDVFGPREPPPHPSPQTRGVRTHAHLVPRGHERTRERPLLRIECADHSMHTRKKHRPPAALVLAVCHSPITPQRSAANSVIQGDGERLSRTSRACRNSGRSPLRFTRTATSRRPRTR